MYFQLKTLILWSKNGQHRRLVHFKPGHLNVIAGASKTGKSAVIPIIDYCLGADKCAIPVGVIRESCGWFGIVVETVEGEKLLARREPGEQRQTGDMYVIEGEVIEIPQIIEQRNSNTNEVKALLDRLSGLPQLGFEPQSDAASRSRPSFRDLMAFLFQPQNIIANPNVLFFKADATEHREKLRTIFPFVLNAVTATVLAARWEIAELQRALRRKQRELQATVSTAQIWRTEAQAWTQQAIELGLLPAETSLPDAWPDILQLLRTVTGSTSRSARPTSAALDISLSRLEALREEESEAASELSNVRQKYNELRRLQQSSEAYGSALLIQRDRLSLSQWLRSQASENDDVLASLSPHGRRDLDALFAALEGIETRVRSRPAMSDSLDKERIRLSTEVERAIQKLNDMREQISALEAESDEAKEALYRLDRVDRFLGRLEQAIVLYDRADDNADLRQEIDSLESKVQDLMSEISFRDIQRRQDNALRTVAAHTRKDNPKTGLRMAHGASGAGCRRTNGKGSSRFA